MPITQINNITLKNITDIINITSGDPSELFINANHIMFGGWYWFIMLWVLGFVLYKLAQRKQDQPLVNSMYVFTIITILSFILRAMTILHDGVVWGMLTDWQMWIFPLFTVFLATINHYSS